MVFALLASDKICPQQGRELRAEEGSRGKELIPFPALARLRLIPSPRGARAPSVCHPRPPHPRGEGRGAVGSAKGRLFVDIGTPRMNSAAVPEGSWAHSDFGWIITPISSPAWVGTCHVLLLGLQGGKTWLESVFLPWVLKIKPEQAHCSHQPSFSGRAFLCCSSTNHF